MEFSEVLAKRRSVRHFNSKLDVADEDIRALIEAGVEELALRQVTLVELEDEAVSVE